MCLDNIQKGPLTFSGVLVLIGIQGIMAFPEGETQYRQNKTVKYSQYGQYICPVHRARPQLISV